MRQLMRFGARQWTPDPSFLGAILSTRRSFGHTPSVPCFLNRILVGLGVLLACQFATAATSVDANALQTEAVLADATGTSPSGAERNDWHYGKKGLSYDPHGPTNLWVGIRLQTRFEQEPEQTPTVENIRRDQDSDLDLNRARLKGGGALAADWLEVYFEYNQPSDALLDLRATLKFTDTLLLRIGQWKSEFNRERIDSSGKQQMAERSISNYWFAIDRQPGIALSGRLGRGTRGDSNWWVEYLSGQGRGGGWASGSRLWLARYQWNPQGEPLPFSQSDLEHRERALTSVAVAVVEGETPYSRFSGAGGGQLPGISGGNQALTQCLFETAAHWRGMSWQQEWHIKRLRDKQLGTRRNLRGGYVQLGSFINEWWTLWPARLELAGRLSMVDPDRSLTGNSEKERSIGLNWFFRGHRNKLTLDYSWLNVGHPVENGTRNRLRLQWELSL